MEKSFVIIGGGTAAVSAVKSIRDYDKTSKITIFGKEPSLPYIRIKLTKDLFKDLNSEKVLIKPLQWYKDNNINLITDDEAIKIDTENKLIYTTKGDEVNYDKLALCTGSYNRKLNLPGCGKAGVFSIREISDASSIVEYIKDKEDVLLIGGGIQGLETAWSIYKEGKKPIIVEVAPRLMFRQLDEKAAETLKENLEASGVKVYLDTNVKEIIGDSTVSGVVINDKDTEVIKCDSVIYSIGIIPNIDLVKGSEISSNRGIIVNEKMETSLQNIYSAGDVAELNGTIEGLWSKASDQGTIAGSNMVGEALCYKKAVPFTMLNAFNTSLFSIGNVVDVTPDLYLIEETEEKYRKVLITNNKVTGAIFVGDTSALTTFKACIEKDITLEGIDTNEIKIDDLILQIKAKLKG